MRALFCVLTLTFSSLEAHAQTNATARHLEQRARPALVLSGALVFLTGYVPGVVIAGASGMKGTTPLLLLPVAGSFSVARDDLDSRHCPLRIDTTDCHATFVWPLITAMGIAQLAGVVMFGAGLIKRDVWKDVSVVPAGFAVRF